MGNESERYSSVILAHFKAKVGKNSKKLKIVRCNNLTILNNILKVPMYPLGAWSKIKVAI
jgi:hypothetical protein